ncbi:similar to interphotoreceptor retinoid-binding protein [Pseudoalteromonas luteoviolacea B = ATCC 29581]|nr:similar to interphotoreceptor retinoid-binding protein [Pseudoalteromonas luteoviolacea B = ATCC 29581]
MLKLLYLLLLIISFSSVALNTAERQAIHSALKKTIEVNYVESEKVPAILRSLDNLQNAPTWRAIENKEVLAELLTHTLEKSDTHFSVNQIPTQSEIHAKESWFDKLKRKNFGFSAIEILPGNIGYLNVWGFAQTTERAKEKVAAVMKTLDNSDALIIDLRENQGGDARMVQLFSSFFLGKKTHLNSFYNRSLNTTVDYWSEQLPKDKARPRLPLYILVGEKTFSAAEEFAYNFKHLNRATIIGKRTKGGANPWQYFPLPNGFRVAIPTAKAINPITKTNWEGVGVIPHIDTREDSAKNVAYKMALAHLIGLDMQKNNLGYSAKERQEAQSLLFNAKAK